MIITKTPVRVSLLGGGTDFPVFSRKHGGMVVGGAINKFSFITARHLPAYHAFRHRLVYREIETVQSIQEMRHQSVKACLEYLNWPDLAGLEISHLADLPTVSSVGSSSTFLVGLLHALAALRGELRLPYQLAEQAMEIEQHRMGLMVGCQNQVFAAYGGLNSIHFLANGAIHIHPLALDAAHVAELESHLMLFFTRLPRTASEVSASYASFLGSRERDQFAMLRFAEQGIEAIYDKDWERLGKLVDQSWRVKRGLSEAITNLEVDALYIQARLAGAFGGKLTGAGGGCMILVVPPDRHEAVREALKECVYIPFQFNFTGSSIVFCDKDNHDYRANR